MVQGAVAAHVRLAHDPVGDLLLHRALVGGLQNVLEFFQVNGFVVVLVKGIRQLVNELFHLHEVSPSSEKAHELTTFNAVGFAALLVEQTKKKAQVLGGGVDLFFEAMHGIVFQHGPKLL